MHTTAYASHWKHIGVYNAMLVCITEINITANF